MIPNPWACTPVKTIDIAYALRHYSRLIKIATVQYNYDSVSIHRFNLRLYYSEWYYK